jgi:hypothetical protein
MMINEHFIQMCKGLTVLMEWEGSLATCTCTCTCMNCVLVRLTIILQQYMYRCITIQAAYVMAYATHSVFLVQRICLLSRFHNLIIITHT